MLGNEKENTELFSQYIKTHNNTYLNKLYDNVYPYSFNMTRKYIDKDYFTKDIINDSLISLIDNAEKFDIEREFNPWYLVILFNNINAFNKRETKFSLYFDMTFDKFGSVFMTKESESFLINRLGIMNAKNNNIELEREEARRRKWMEQLSKIFTNQIPEEYMDILVERFVYNIAPRYLIEDGICTADEYKKMYYALFVKHSNTISDMFLNNKKYIDFVEQEFEIYWSK